MSKKIEQFQIFDAQAITTEEDWAAFMAAFCPGIPCQESVDFANHGLIVSVMLGARPTYIAANKILGIDPEYGCPVLEDSAASCVYALNTDNHTHFYITAIALPREQIPDHLALWTK